ncbi:putative sarcosine oxidase protein [Phaeoacremonium minimum UCRPA7]|uniref:Putative sarcosine oxidase protein n=1 Tax=Phaeoacremonium minimum (strain UCR-PA7) TaxID=1286976 RepID=R8BWM7_PHAM7|nr:putative sarcosine oxidase protein [Phaeoacremonium minimum UCRPA7]EOO03758.1 putative sarcosine oxidase protein [Phaeoacremonium minimum UCRPA7]
MNKIIRAAYGPEVVYQNIALEAMQGWESWNKYLAKGRGLPPGMTKEDRIWVNNGNLQVCGQMELPPFERHSIANMEKIGKRTSQVVVSDPRDVEQARRDGFMFAVDPFNRRVRGKLYQALLDTTGGFVYADKVCRLALHLCRQAGVKFVLGDAGEFVSYLEKNGEVVGVETKDGTKHRASLTVVACGGWTNQIVPQLDGLCETTGGSVAVIKIPKSSHLYERFSPRNFPTFTYKMRDGTEGGMYGFPLDEFGHLKFGYRGTKYTNPQLVNKDEKSNEKVYRSIPITKWSKPASLTQIPSEAMDKIRDMINDLLPEIGEEGHDIAFTRMCWYNDSFDNHFVVDAVPQRKGLFVATGGSGHAFMFFPNIGKYVVDRIEGKENDVLDFWKWRGLAADQIPINKLALGTASPRALQNLQLTTDNDLKLSVGARRIATKL